MLFIFTLKVFQCVGINDHAIELDYMSFKFTSIVPNRQLIIASQMDG